MLEDLLADPSHRVDHRPPDRLKITMQDTNLGKSAEGIVASLVEDASNTVLLQGFSTNWKLLNTGLSQFHAALEESAANYNQLNDTAPSQPVVPPSLVTQPVLAPPVVDDHEPHVRA